MSLPGSGNSLCKDPGEEMGSACSGSARKPVQLEWSEVGEKQEVKEGAGSQITQSPRRLQYGIWILSSLRIPHALQESPGCVSGWESASPLLSLFPINWEPPRTGIRGLPLAFELTLSRFLLGCPLPKISLSMEAQNCLLC